MFGVSSSRISRAIYAIGLCITDWLETLCIYVASAPLELSEGK